jgi:hypothetical protein
MARTDGRHNSHIQEKRPPAGGGAPAAAPTAAEERRTDLEGGRPAWRWAATVWAVVFLFLTLLAVFDLIAGLWRGRG